MMKKHYKKLLNRKALAATAKAIALTLLGAATLTACSPQAYVPSVIRTSASAPGSFYIPPKVDFLLAQDDTGSQLSVYNQVAAQMPGLLEEMEATGWDYHFATSVLSDRSRNSISQIAAGRYDLNWGSEWIAPFPGAPADASTMQVSPSFFRKAADFTDYLPASRVSNVSQGTENGLATVYDALSAKLSGTGFLRPDALLVVLTVSNGEDTSGVTYCDSYNRIIGDAKDELILPCEQTSFATSSNSTYSASLSYYESKLLELKSNSRALIRFYSAVSSRTRSGTSCLGSAAYKGDRYMRMASALGGESYDICTQSAASVLSDLKAQLDAIRGDFETGYLMVQEEPDLTTVEVIKYVGGDASQAIVIPQSETDGWSYAGYLEQVPLIDTPVAMNFATGYAIKLNGAARLQGSDTAKVSYKTAEGQVSATE